MNQLLDPSRLVTVGTYAAQYNGGKGVTRAYIYKLIKAGKLETVQIDRVQFVVLPPPTGGPDAGRGPQDAAGRGRR